VLKNFKIARLKSIAGYPSTCGSFFGQTVPGASVVYWGGGAGAWGVVWAGKQRAGWMRVAAPASLAEDVRERQRTMSEFATKHSPAK